MLNNTVYTIDFEIDSEKKDSLKVYKTARKVFFLPVSHFRARLDFSSNFSQSLVQNLIILKKNINTRKIVIK